MRTLLKLFILLGLWAVAGNMVSGCATQAQYYDMQFLTACSKACSDGGMKKVLGCHCK